MDIYELVERLKKLAINIPKKTLIRWAYTEGIIQKPERHKDKRGKNEIGRGKKSDWSTKALEEAAAVWAVREACRTQKICHAQKKRLSPDEIRVIKSAAAVLDERPYAIYTLPSVTGPLLKQHLDPKKIKMTFVSDNYDGLYLFPGKDKLDKAKCLNELVVTWVAAREKVRDWASKTMLFSNIVQRYPDLAHLAPNEVDLSKVDWWPTKVPDPWRIDKPALIELCWLSKPSNNGWTYWRLQWPLRSPLRESDEDEIVLIENGVDTRVFFKVDVGDRQGWAKAEREETERKIQSSTSTMEKIALEMYKDRLKNWFDV
jgi:hypothetical protein